MLYLPRKEVQGFEKGQSIYDPQQPSRYLYMVLLGRVKVTRTAEDGHQIMVRLICSEGVFGEGCLVTSRSDGEGATALTAVSLMAWSGPKSKNIPNASPG